MCLFCFGCGMCGKPQSPQMKEYFSKTFDCLKCGSPLSPDDVVCPSCGEPTAVPAGESVSAVVEEQPFAAAGVQAGAAGADAASTHLEEQLEQEEQKLERATAA